ncbi:EF0163 family protein [Enterococcus rivorum]|uniref:Lipoprotein n=2 Tax=Enterococcus rivorum TaxID=762845 RepID=A0A1E5KXU4_9ENTE|nr:hypothetical protein BCR26_13390 [Enterococcus rivorum]
MKLLSLSVLLLSISACKKQEESTKSSDSENKIIMQRVEDKEIKQDNSKIEFSTSSKERTIQTDKKMLEKVGNTFANFSTLNNRNDELKKYMTEECIKNNAIDSKTDVKFASTGYIEGIYELMSDKEEKYAIYLKCKQNGFDTNVLLFVKVKDNKISEMTYNTVKQEY